MPIEAELDESRKLFSIRVPHKQNQSKGLVEHSFITLDYRSSQLLNCPKTETLFLKYKEITGRIIQTRIVALESIGEDYDKVRRKFIRSTPDGKTDFRLPSELVGLVKVLPDYVTNLLSRNK